MKVGKELYCKITDVMYMLEQLPCGGIGGDGATMKELKVSAKNGQCCEDDSIYHTGQLAWRMLEEIIKGE